MTDDTSKLKSTAITFVGVRTDKYAEMKEFVEGALGYAKKSEEDGFTAYQSSQSQRVEIFDLTYPGKEYFTTGPVPGFEVADFDGAVDWLRRNSYEVLGEIVTSSSGTRWTHFRGPDGNVYEFVYHPELH